MDRIRSLFLLGGGLLVTGGALFAKETFAWLIGKGWDAATRAFRSEAPAMTGGFGDFPWLNALGLLAFVAGFYCVFAGFRTAKAITTTVNDLNIDERWDGTPQFNHRGLYVGQMIVDTHEVTTHRMVKVLVRILNGTNRHLNVLRIEGNFRIENSNGPDELALRPILNTPVLSQDSTSTVEVNAEATIKLDQHVTADLAAHLARLSEDIELVLFCKHLRIIMEELERNRRIDLPLWDGVLLSKKTNEFSTRRGFWDPMRKRPEFN